MESTGCIRTNLVEKMEEWQLKQMYTTKGSRSGNVIRVSCRDIQACPRQGNDTTKRLWEDSFKNDLAMDDESCKVVDGDYLISV